MAITRTTITPSGSVITTDVLAQTTITPDGIVLNASVLGLTQYSFDYYIYDVDGDTYSAVATATVLAPGAPLGAGTVTLSVKGVPTFTYTTLGKGKKKKFISNYSP